MISLKRFSRYTKQQYKTLLSQASKRNYYKNSTNNKKYFSFTSAGLVAIAGITAYTFKREEKTLPIIQCEESYKFPTERLKKPKSGRGIILVECGSFNPPTYLHLRLFEDARDYLEKEEKIEVLGGFMSPVHPEYLKHDKTSGEHRLIMAKLAASQSDWISVDDWEMYVVFYRIVNIAYSKQPSYRYTKDVLHHFKEEITKFYGKDADNIRVALLCGADLLKSFTQPGVWSDEDVCIHFSHSHKTA